MAGGGSWGNFSGRGSLCRGPETVHALCIRETARQSVRLEQDEGESSWDEVQESKRLDYGGPCRPSESHWSEVKSH